MYAEAEEQVMWEKRIAKSEEDDRKQRAADKEERKTKLSQAKGMPVSMSVSIVPLC